MSEVIKVEVGGRELRLRYTFNALCEMEAVLGRPALHVIVGLSDMRWRDLRGMLWAGGLHDPKAPSLVELGELIQADLVAHGKRSGGHRELYARYYGAINDALVRDGVVAVPGEETKDAAEGNAPAPTA